MRWRELFGYGLAMVLCLVLACVGVARAGGLQAGFQSSTDPCGNDPSLVFCYRGDVDTSGNLVDHSGENLLTDRTEIDDWTEQGTCAVTADQWRSPVSGLLTADYLDNTGGANTNRRYQLVGAKLAGDVHTFSVWLRADYTHTISLGMEFPGFVLEDFTVTTTWQRFSMTRTMTANGNLYVDIVPGDYGTSTGTVYASDAQVILNDRYRTNQGIYLNPADQSVTKPTHDLAPTNAPTRALSDAEYQGNRLKARDFDGTNYYSKAHHDSMDVFDSDHTLTMYVYIDSTTQNYSTLFSHTNGGGTLSGMQLYCRQGTTTLTATYGDGAGGTVAPANSGTLTKDTFHIIQVVRSSNIATLYVDGVAGTPLDVTGYGVDADATLNLMTYPGAIQETIGKDAFSKLESFARNADELASDREKIWGMATGQGSSFAGWDIARSTVAMKTFKAGGAHIINKKMTEVAANIPRVTLEGLLVEGQATQLHGFTDEFGTWTQSGTCAVTADDVLAPDGTLTADELDNTGGANADRRTVTTADLGDLTGRTFTGTVFARADTPHIVTLRLFESGVGGIDSNDVYVTGEWQRIIVTGAAGGGGDNTLILLAYPGENGVATGVAHFWRANLTETTFPVSSIDNPGGAATQVTRTADDITMDPCADAQSCVLPLAFGGAGEPDKLTISFEAKCQYSAAADIGQARSLIEISAAAASTNRVYFELASNGRAWFRLRSSVSGNHNAFTAIDPVDFSQWHRYWGVLDFADLSRMEFWIDGDSSGMSYGSNSGVAEFSLVDAKIRVGQTNAAVVNANCEFRKPLIRAEELRP